MLTASADPIDQFPALLARLPPDIDLESMARESGAFRRPRCVHSGTDLFRLTLAWGVSDQSLQQIAAWAGAEGIATLTDEALLYRLHQCPPFLRAVIDKLLPGLGSPIWRGRVLRIADSSSLSGRASKGTDWRIHGVYDLGRGGFSHLEISDGHGAEALDRDKPVTGEIRVADRGYANAQSWQRFLQSSSDAAADFIVRMRWNTVRLVDAARKPFDIIDWLRALPETNETHEITCAAQSGKHQTPLPIRLIARRKPAQAVQDTHKRLRQQASRKQHALDPRSLIAAQYLIVATSLPEAEFPACDVLAVYRLRWQIELAFKRLKSLLHVGNIRTRTDAGTRCWLYAKLILALLCDDLSQDLLESFPSGAF